MPNWCSNSLNINGPEKDIHLFKTKANGPNQTYHDYHARGGDWPVHDDIRVKALFESLPEQGEASVFSFHALYPVPDEVRKLPYDSSMAQKVADSVGLTGPTKSGFDWEIQNWGCKWGASEPELQLAEDSYLEYSFQTAWAPPMGFLEKTSEYWPTLSFEVTYEEPGMGFAGKSVFENGEEVEHDEWEMEPEEDYDE
jgi:hypothetical protein